MGLVEHARARIEPDHDALAAHDRERLARNQPRPGGDVEHAHAALQSRALERAAPVPGTAAEPEELLDEVVIGGGAVEQAVHVLPAAALVGPVLGQYGNRCALAEAGRGFLVEHAKNSTLQCSSH